MDLLSVKIFITFATIISTGFNVETLNLKLDTIISALALYYTIKQDRRAELERKKQTAPK